MSPWANASTGPQRSLSLVLLSTMLLSLVICSTETREVVPFRRNIDTVFKEWSCRDPKPRLVYLGKYQFPLQSTKKPMNTSLPLTWPQRNGLIWILCWIIAEDEYDDYDPSALYLPHALVVNRCERSIGCCKPGQICSSVEEEEITFEVQAITPRREKLMKQITLTSHVKCECQNSQDPPR